MDDSKNYDSLIDALFEGKTSADEAARLLGETGGEELEELAEIVETLARIDPELSTPTDEEFRGARHQVMTQIRESQAPAATGRVSWWLPIAAALAAFAVGMTLGRGNTPAAPALLTLTDLVNQGALETRVGAENPFRYSNLRVREVAGDQLAVRVDVEAELEVVRPRDDVLVADILASSMLHDDSLGSRLKAVRHVGSNPRVQRALMSAALNDPDMSVRLKALQRLVAEDVTLPETQETLLVIVAQEESVAMRLMAIEALQDDYLGADLLETLDNTDPDDGSAVLWSAQQRLERRSL